METMERGREDKPEKRSRWGRKRMLALGVVALAAVTFTANAMNNQSGKSYLHKAKVESVDPDSMHFGVVDWNMQNKTSPSTPALRKMIAKYSADVVMMQEVSSDQSKSIAKRFEGWNVNFVMGDRLLQEPAEGGFGNVIMTRQKPKDVKTMSIPAKSTVSTVTSSVSGLFVDVAHADTGTPNMKVGMQEQRAIVAETIRMSDEDKREVRLITTHVSGIESVHGEQLDKVYNFVKKEIKPGRPTIFCADLNDNPENIIPKFTNLGFIVPQMEGPSSANFDIVIDYCMYRGEGILGLAETGIDHDYKTDHYPLYGVWTPNASGQQ